MRHSYRGAPSLPPARQLSGLLPGPAAGPAQLPGEHRRYCRYWRLSGRKTHPHMSWRSTSMACPLVEREIFSQRKALAIRLRQTEGQLHPLPKRDQVATQLARTLFGDADIRPLRLSIHPSNGISRSDSIVPRTRKSRGRISNPLAARLARFGRDGSEGRCGARCGSGRRCGRNCRIRAHCGGCRGRGNTASTREPTNGEGVCRAATSVHLVHHYHEGSAGRYNHLVCICSPLAGTYVTQVVITNAGRVEVTE